MVEFWLNGVKSKFDPHCNCLITLHPRKKYPKESEEAARTQNLPMLWPVRKWRAALEPNVAVLTNLKCHVTSFRVVVVDYINKSSLGGLLTS